MALPKRISPPWSTTLKVIVGVLGILVTGLAAYTFRVVFVPIILGMIIAYVLTPLAKLLSRITRLPHGLTSALVFFILLALVIPLGIIGGQVLFEQSNVIISEVIVYIRGLSARSADTLEFLGFEIVIGDIVKELTTASVATLRSLASDSVGLVLRSARTIIMGIFTIVIGFYLTRDSDKVIAALIGLIPPDYREDGLALLSEIDTVWSAFLRGQVILSLTVMVILTVLSALLGLPQPLLLGVWGGLLEFLPSIGNMIWGATAIVLALVGGSSYLPFPPAIFLLIVVAVYIAFSQVDMNILIPNIIGGQVRLHPMVVLIGVIIGLTVGGVLGVALAAPTIASLRVIGGYLYAKIFDLDPFPVKVVPAGTPPVRPQSSGGRPAEASSGVFVRRKKVKHEAPASSDE